ncbi:MAG: TM2 domain-containing protein [Bacilli bacterium]|nr:TM2 domain-containing protein [Bacilli bacterium]
MANYVTVTSDKDKKTAMILCCLGFFGIGGIHDFYLGKFGAGLIKLITINWFMVGTIIDLIKIATGSYKDNSGAPLRQ